MSIIFIYIAFLIKIVLEFSQTSVRLMQDQDLPIFLLKNYLTYVYPSYVYHFF